MIVHCLMDMAQEAARLLLHHIIALTNKSKFNQKEGLISHSLLRNKLSEAGANTM